MLVNVVFDADGKDFDVIDVPESLAKDIKKIQLRFFDWLHAKGTEHEYWVRIDGMEGYSYGTDEFVEWINSQFCNEGNKKTIIISRNLTELKNNNPTIYF